MPDFETYLNLLLKGSPPPTTLGLNLFPVMPPGTPNTPTSYCVYTLISSPKNLTQETGDQGTRFWEYQFVQYGPSQAVVLRDTESLSAFLINYRDMPGRPGIMRAYEINTYNLVPSATGRTFGRAVHIHFTENLPSS